MYCICIVKKGHYDIPEVCLYFDNQLFRGNRTTKVNTSGLRAFDSPNMSPLAEVGITTKVRWELVRRQRHTKLKLRTHFCNDITIFRIFPGPFTTLENSLAPPLRGIILQTFGCGNVPDDDPHLLAALREATSRGITAVNISQCTKGSVEAHYATGMALHRAGVISGSDMTGEAALVKLGWLIGSGANPEKVRELMALDLRGELTIPTVSTSIHPKNSLRVDHAFMKAGKLIFYHLILFH